jgi:hypothetical protein
MYPAIHHRLLSAYVPTFTQLCSLAAFGLFMNLAWAQTPDTRLQAQETLQKQTESQVTYQPDEWIPLFNGRDLEGWTPKIRYHKVGENFGNTFRVADGILQVRYDQYEQFNETFGHLFYKDSFSDYVLRIEYRFVGDQVKGGPGWAWRNSGVMLHGQTPESMAVDQDFPVSIEAQFLGGDGTNSRPTLNLCTPGTHIEMQGKLVTRHCTNSTSNTYHGDQWVTVEIEVRNNQAIRHLIDGKEVLAYQKPQLDPNDASAKPLIKDGQVQLSQGTISLQSESHPIDFRKVEIKKLEPTK